MKIGELGDRCGVTAKTISHAPGHSPGSGTVALVFNADVIDQNARLVGEQSVTRLLGSIASDAPFLQVKPIEPRIILKENLPQA